MVDQTTANTSAIVANSLSWDADAVRTQVPEHARTAVFEESVNWQYLSQSGSEAEGFAYPAVWKRQLTHNGVLKVIPPHSGTPPREPNRIFELHGLMGAIGEQLGLACTIERDVQRFLATADERTPEHQRLIQRALAETSGYFVLGAIHSVGNLVLRLLLLNASAAATVNGKYGQAGGFPPLSDNREAWRTLNPGLVTNLAAAAKVSGNQVMTQAVTAVQALQASPAFIDLDNRRGMDYHRRRPQSVEHASPRKPAVTVAGNTTTTTGFAPQLEPEADADKVHAIVVAAMEQLTSTMTELRALIPDAIRAEGITYISA